METRTLVRHYVRTDLIERKRLALAAWDEQLQKIVDGSVGVGGTVVQFRILGVGAG